MNKELREFRERAFEDLEQFVYNEDNWKKMFETKRTFGEVMADHVSNFGGSWVFVISLFSFIITWAVLNKALPETHQWDPYPYILLNLFLSIIAACQAPIIMMSQKRIEARDRSQRAYIDKFVLRSEKQIAHVNEKLDFIVDKLFKEDDTNALVPVVLPEKGASKRSRSVQKDSRVKTDKHLAYLLCKLNSFYSNTLTFADDDFIFTHWNYEGDNFYGFVSNVQVIQDPCTGNKKVSYEINFSVTNVTLDDIFSGDYELRNDLSLEHMDADGKFEDLQVLLPNGTWEKNIPAHYKPSFTINRVDKINDFWKQKLVRVRVVYVPLCMVSTEEEDLAIIKSV